MALCYQLPLLEVPLRYVTPPSAPEPDYSELEVLPPPCARAPTTVSLRPKKYDSELPRQERDRRAIRRIEIQAEQDAEFWEEEEKKRVETETLIAQLEPMNYRRLLIAFALDEVRRLNQERRAMGDLGSLGPDIDSILKMLSEHQASDIEEDLAAMAPRYKVVSIPEMPGPSLYIAPARAPEPDYSELDALPALIPVEPASAFIIPADGPTEVERSIMIMEYKRREADRYAREAAYFAEQHRRTMQRIEIQEDQDAVFWEEERKKREGMEA
ncbi:hypothetical protein DFH08DRAFT_803719 [Mycena albidolilacea]|uniref:Uncharacterized protein n=1 Tax=Mycena albidolilacea TaxID=1033008 RepID=A0AAD7ADG4_9AGAR|nr:hypothetical protein DFH08DRAFT_803719 [Mycena albidolilacea]